MVDNLIEQGLQALTRGDLEAAARAGRELIAQRHSSGFELLARALSRQGQTAQALDVLDEGLARLPGHWRFLELKGMVLADGGRPEEALAFYREALAQPEATRRNVHYNAGLTSLRAGLPSEAARHFQAAEDASEPGTDLWGMARTRRIQALLALGRTSEASELAESAGLRDAEFLRTLGWARLEDGDREGALRLVRELLGEHDETAFWLLRQAEPAEEGRHYRVLMRGAGFFRTYEVVARSPADLLALVGAVEEALELDEVLEERETDAPRGVYWRSELISWEEEASRPATERPPGSG